MTIYGDGHKLKPLLDFKGKHGGRIECVLTSFRADCHYGVQEKVWMDEQLLHCWIDHILAPDIESAPPGIITIVILDFYRVYLMSSVVNRIEDLGAEVWHIPGGCTSLCQPVDVGFNKLLKDCICAGWEEGMIKERLASGKFPTCKQVTHWTINAYNDISNEIVWNAWRHADYSWFDD